VLAGKFKIDALKFCRNLTILAKTKNNAPGAQTPDKVSDNFQKATAFFIDNSMLFYL
jgi:hypothetical protein